MNNFLGRHSQLLILNEKPVVIDGGITLPGIEMRLRKSSLFGVVNNCFRRARILNCDYGIWVVVIKLCGDLQTNVLVRQGIPVKVQEIKFVLCEHFKDPLLPIFGKTCRGWIGFLVRL